jgi:hypothetical protein
MELMQYTIPALIVFATSFLITFFFLRNDEKRRSHELRLGINKQIIPIRLQAYERIILFLERISPENLLVRINKPGMSSSDLQSELLRTIRAEFEHNLSQQVYISSKAWEIVVSAKEHMVKQINTSSMEIKPDAPSMQLARTILESVMKDDIKSTFAAIEFLKKEVRQIF